MSAPTREVGITYGAYTVATTDDVHITTDGPDISSIRFDFEIAHADASTFAGMVASAETAFRTPRKDCVITVRGSTWKTLSHSGGTGFNAKPEIEKTRRGRSANSIIYTVRIDFGRPADVHDTSYRRNSTVKLTWTTDRRLHVEVDGVYTCNGSTTGRAQYLAAIGDYATAILTGLGSFDLLEEHVVNDDQNKVATFHRKYDEQIDGRNEAEIVIETQTDGRKRVTISGMYSTIIAATSSYTAYTTNYPAFKTAVLAAIGGTFEVTSSHAEKNDTDFVTTFTNVYEEMLTGRKDGSYQILYSTDRRMSVFFYANYFTGISGSNAYTLAKADFPTWVLGIIGGLGGTFNKRSESYQPNDVSPPNHCSARLEFLEAYVSQAGSLPHSSIRDQNYKVEMLTEAPGDQPDAGVRRMVALNVEYMAQLDHDTTVNLPAVWAAVCSWLLTTIAKDYQPGPAALMENNPSYNPDNNILSGKLKIWIAPATLLLYRMEVSDSVEQGKIFDGLWTGDPMDFHVYPGHINATKRISKTYRRILGTQTPAPSLNTDLRDPSSPSLVAVSSGEGGSDPFGMLKGLKGHVISREQPRRTVLELGGGVSGQKFKVEDITFTITIRYVNESNANSVGGGGVRPGGSTGSQS